MGSILGLVEFWKFPNLISIGIFEAYDTIAAWGIGGRQMGIGIRTYGLVAFSVGRVVIYCRAPSIIRVLLLWSPCHPALWYAGVLVLQVLLEGFCFSDVCHIVSSSSFEAGALWGRGRSLCARHA